MKSGGITDKTIGEIRKAIDDEFNDNVRRLMRSKQSEPQMTVKPKNGGQSEYQRSGLNLQRQEFQLPSNKWNQTRHYPSLEQRRQCLYFDQQTQHAGKGRTNPKKRISRSAQTRRTQHSNNPRNAEGANRRQCRYIEYGPKACHQLTITNRVQQHKLRKRRISPDPQIKVLGSPQKKSSD